ncbi:glycine cleavage system protein GcvH [Planctomycetota bacterium]
MGRPTDCRYQKSHEWIKVEDGGIAVVGLTDYAVKALRDLVAFDLEQTDGEIKKGESFAVIESVKAAADIYAPVSGEITDVNDDLADDIDILAQDPFGKGWMIKIKMQDAAQLQDLLDLDSYEKYLATEEE